MYASLRQDFGLPAVEPTEQLTIEVVIAVEPEQRFASVLHGKRVIVPSPALLPVAVELTGADMLAQHVVTVLVEQITNATDAKGGDLWKWHNLITAVRRWQLWQHNGALTAWHNQVTTWLYSMSRISPNGASTDGNDICRNVSIIEATAPAGAPGLAAWCAKSAHLQQLLLQGKPAVHLHELVTAPMIEWTGQGYAWPDWYRYTPLETVVDYAVITYGRERLPILLTALDHHHTWETLIPAVFNVSAGEFERGWQAYLRARYHLSIFGQRLCPAFPGDCP